MENLNKNLSNFINNTPDAYNCVINIKKILEKDGFEEFRRRKRLLRDLDTDEKVREALCQLCGKDSYLDI